MDFRCDNHYVPCVSLKHFAASTGRVWTYRTLVAHDRVPEWQEKSVKGIGYLAHLYTRIVSGVESDEIEKWLAAEFESPAQEALFKATQDRRLSPADWHNLIRYLAAQDIRTPARLLENLPIWKEWLPAVINDTLQDSVRELEDAKKSGQTIDAVKAPNSDYIPMRITRETEPGQEYGTVKSEVIVGRSLWLFAMRHVLTNTVKTLHDHKWTILIPPNNLTWFTSDDPVIRLNYYSRETYDFKGGWGKPGTEIFLPLDPRHLLYTMVGKRPPQRRSVVSKDLAAMIRRFIAEHAHRFIFAASTDADVPRLRPRIVDMARVCDERDRWRRWHEDQSNAERALMVSDARSTA
jgi:hypothetical protein